MIDTLLAPRGSINSTEATMMMRCQRLTFAYVCDVEVEAADGEVGVLDLQRHCCLLALRGRPAGERDVSSAL
jgi:hypothetical protein